MGGSVNIFHQIWPNYRENLQIFCFFRGGSENFSLKNFFREGDLGGVYTELLNFGGGLDGIGRKWGGVSIWRPKGAKLVHPPPWDVYDTFPNHENVLDAIKSRKEDARLILPSSASTSTLTKVWLR